MSQKRSKATKGNAKRRTKSGRARTAPRNPEEMADGSGLDLSEENFIDEDAPGRPIAAHSTDLPADPLERAEVLAKSWVAQRAALKAQKIAGLNALAKATEHAERALREQLLRALEDSGEGV